MNERMLISVVITTYNRPDALERVLLACLAQHDPHYELIVADDGSGPATRELVQRLAATTSLPLHHVWHPDEGFRAAAIRNKGIAAARGHYIVFLDGDCVPQHDFVMQHRRLAEEDAVVTGSRILLSEALTERVIAQGIALADARPGFWLRERLAGNVNKIVPLWAKLPDRSWRRLDRFKWRGIKSCNMSAWRDDLERVNGFDETFVGWGHEDADLVARLFNAGVDRKLGAYATEIFHLWHREQPRDREGPNHARVVARLQERVTRAETGIAELDAAGL